MKKIGIFVIGVLLAFSSTLTFAKTSKLPSIIITSGDADAADLPHFLIRCADEACKTINLFAKKNRYRSWTRLDSNPMKRDWLIKVLQKAEASQYKSLLSQYQPSGAIAPLEVFNVFFRASADFFLAPFSIFGLEADKRAEKHAKAVAFKFLKSPRVNMRETSLNERGIRILGTLLLGAIVDSTIPCVRVLNSF